MRSARNMAMELPTISVNFFSDRAMALYFLMWSSVSINSETLEATCSSVII